MESMHDGDNENDNVSEHCEDQGEVPMCRFCQCEGTDDNRLVHPCRCKGSVKWVHEECLRNWLRQSHKVQCELCGYRYVFQRGYGDEFNDAPPRLPLTVFLLDSFNRAKEALLTFLRGALISSGLIFRTLFTLWANHTFLDSSFSTYLPNNIDTHSLLDALNPFSPGNPSNTKTSIAVEDLSFAFLAYAFVGLILTVPYLIFSAALPREYHHYIPFMREIDLLRAELNQQSPFKQIVQYTVYSTLFMGLASGVLVGLPYTLAGSLFDLLSLVSFGTIPSKKTLLTDPTFGGGGIAVKILILCVGYLLIFALLAVSYVLGLFQKNNVNNDEDENENENEHNNNNNDSPGFRKLMGVLRHVFLIVATAVVIPLINGIAERATSPLFCSPFVAGQPKPSGLRYLAVEFVSLHSSGSSYLVGVLVYLFASTPTAGARGLDFLALSLSNWTFAILFSTVLALLNIIFALSASVSCALAFKLFDPSFLPLRGGAIVDKSGLFDSDTIFLLYYTSFAQALYFIPLRIIFSVTFWPLTKILFERRNANNSNENTSTNSIIKKVALVFRLLFLSILHFVFLVITIGPFIYALASFYRSYVSPNGNEPRGIRKLLLIAGICSFAAVRVIKSVVSLLVRVGNVVVFLRTLFRGAFSLFCAIVADIVLTVLVMSLSGICIYMMIGSVYIPSKRQSILLNDDHLNFGFVYLTVVFNISRFVHTMRERDEGTLRSLGRLLKSNFVFWARVALCAMAIRVILENLPFSNGTTELVVEKRYIFSAMTVSLGLLLKRAIPWIRNKYVFARDRRYARVVVRNYED